MTTALYSLVIGDNDENRVSAYLYDHTEIVAVCRCLVRPRTTAYLLRTEVTDGGDEPGSHGTLAASERALFLARYQTERLASGLYGVRVYGVTETAALNELKHWIASEIEALHA